jgi:hypothetical protein
MHDVVFVAIIDDSENLLDQKCGIAFVKLTLFNDLIKKFTSFTNFLDKIVTFVIFKKFEHLDNVGMIQFLQNIDFVEEHLLFILIHIRFTEYLDSALSSCVSVDAHTDFTECSITENLSNTVKISEFSFIFLNEILCAHSSFLFDHSLEVLISS